MKKDYITFDLARGALIAVGIASFSVAFLNIVIKLISKDFGAADEIKIVISVIPSVNIGVTAIFYLVSGCLSLQYMRFLMLFGATRTSAFIRYSARVAITFIPTLLAMIGISLICDRVSGLTLIPYGEYVVTFIISALLCFGAGCFFSSITTLFRPFVSFIVIFTICVASLTVSDLMENMYEAAEEAGYFVFPQPLIGLIAAVILLAASSLIHHVKISDMKTTSIS